MYLSCALCLNAKEKLAVELAPTWVSPWRNQLHHRCSCHFTLSNSHAPLKQIRLQKGQLFFEYFTELALFLGSLFWCAGDTMVCDTGTTLG